MKKVLVVFFIAICGMLSAQNSIENVELRTVKQKIDKHTFQVNKFHENGVIAEKGLWVKGKKEGLWQGFDTAGNLVYQAEFSNGEKHGKWVVYNDDATTKYLLYYSQGERLDAIDVTNLAQK